MWELRIINVLIFTAVIFVDCLQEVKISSHFSAVMTHTDRTGEQQSSEDRTQRENPFLVGGKLREHVGLTAGKGTYPRHVRLIASLPVPATAAQVPSAPGLGPAQPLPTAGQHLAGVDTQRLGGGGPGEEAPRHAAVTGCHQQKHPGHKVQKSCCPRPPPECLLPSCCWSRLSVNLLK